MAAKRGEAAVALCQADENLGIGCPPVPAQAAEHRLIAEEFDIPVGEDIHAPHQGIPPMQADGGCQKELCQGVKPLDVHEFVLEDVKKGRRVIPVRVLWQ